MNVCQKKFLSQHMDFSILLFHQLFFFFNLLLDKLSNELSFSQEIFIHVHSPCLTLAL